MHDAYKYVGLAVFGDLKSVQVLAEDRVVVIDAIEFSPTSGSYAESIGILYPTGTFS
jgi:hypothetical protein